MKIAAVLPPASMVKFSIIYGSDSVPLPDIAVLLSASLPSMVIGGSLFSLEEDIEFKGFLALVNRECFCGFILSWGTFTVVYTKFKSVKDININVTTKITEKKLLVMVISSYY